MLKVEGLQVKYGDFVAVSSASMDVAEGGITALIGANGAGKSSLLNAIAGTLGPSDGRVLFNGEDITSLPAHEVVGRRLCLVPQGGRCFPRMSVYDNLMTGAYVKAARKQAQDSLDRVYDLFPDLRNKSRELAGTLSGGQRQMLAIGRALMSRPRCVMFDEISLGLAPVAIKKLYECIATINHEEGITAVVVEQDTGRALRIADTCVLMEKGAVVMEECCDNVSIDKIKSAYFGV